MIDAPLTSQQIGWGLLFSTIFIIYESVIIAYIDYFKDSPLHMVFVVLLMILPIFITSIFLILI